MNYFVNQIRMIEQLPQERQLDQILEEVDPPVWSTVMVVVVEEQGTRWNLDTRINYP